MRQFCEYSFRYKRGVGQLADLLAKERGDPLRDAVWLLELVSETKGAEHLKLQSRKLNLLQYLSLDVLAAYLALIFAVCKGIVVAFRRCASRSRLREKIKSD